MADDPKEQLPEKLPNPDHEAIQVLAKVWNVTETEAKEIANQKEREIGRQRPVNDNDSDLYTGAVRRQTEKMTEAKWAERDREFLKRTNENGRENTLAPGDPRYDRW